MELDYTPSAEGNAALATGIIGTSLGALNLMGNVANGAGLFGMKSNYERSTSTDGHDENITRHEFKETMNYQKELMAKDLQISELQAQKISDQHDTEIYRQVKSEMNSMKADLDAQIAVLNSSVSAQAVQNQANKDSFQILQERMDTNVASLGGAIEREKATRKANDNLIVTYANATFTPKIVTTMTVTGGTVGAETSSSTTYNPLPCCDCND